MVTVCFKFMFEKIYNLRSSKAEIKWQEFRKKKTNIKHCKITYRFELHVAPCTTESDVEFSSTLDWRQAISCNRKLCLMAQFFGLAALFLARFQRTDMYRCRPNHLSLSKPAVWYSVCGLLGCDTVQSYPLIPQFRRNTTASHPENWGKMFHRNVGIHR